VQRPVPEIALHEAPVGHSAPELADGVQMSAHWVGELEPATSRTQLGLAVAPFGTSDGHGVEVEHDGEQKSPATPVIWMASSSALQPPFGSS
jgi:hypothetical protein